MMHNTDNSDYLNDDITHLNSFLDIICLLAVMEDCLPLAPYNFAFASCACCTLCLARIKLRTPGPHT